MIVSEIRERVLANLDEIEPAVSAAWKKYDQEHKSQVPKD